MCYYRKCMKPKRVTYSVITWWYNQNKLYPFFTGDPWGLLDPTLRPTSLQCESLQTIAGKKHPLYYVREAQSFTPQTHYVITSWLLFIFRAAERSRNVLINERSSVQTRWTQFSLLCSLFIIFLFSFVPHLLWFNYSCSARWRWQVDSFFQSFYFIFTAFQLRNRSKDTVM